MGSEITSYPQTIKKIVDGGHKIGIHSYSHRDFEGMSPEEMFEDEIVAVNGLLVRNKGRTNKFIRPPMVPLQGTR